MLNVRLPAGIVTSNWKVYGSIGSEGASATWGAAAWGSAAAGVAGAGVSSAALPMPDKEYAVRVNRANNVKAERVRVRGRRCLKKLKFSELEEEILSLKFLSLL
jgi:hypothetical protein